MLYWPPGVDEPDGVLMLDGLQTGHVLAGRSLALGGALEPGETAPFVNYARRATVGE